jgi:hypothetical protein
MRFIADISGHRAVTKPSLEKIIESLQFCILDARALQLQMLERILAIALLEAHENRTHPMTGERKARDRF